jgi:Tfp pilus assembly ATPase PilU
LKPIGEAATPAARFQDALDLMKGALGDFKRPIEEAIQTLERIRALAPAIESESMLTDMTGNLRDGAAVLRRELHRKGAPGAEIAASLLQAERNLHEQIEQWGHQT